MRNRSRRPAGVIAAAILIIIFTAVLGNYRSMENRTAGRIHKIVTADRMQFYHWNRDAGEGWISGDDPQILITGINAYINNLYLDAEWSGGRNDLTVYYTNDGGSEFTSEKSMKPVIYKKDDGETEIIVKRKVNDLRLDLTEASGIRLEIRSCEMNPRKLGIDRADVFSAAVMAAVYAAFLYYRGRFLSLRQQAEMIWTLVKNDLKSRYAGSFFGLLWAFVQPVMTILVFWIVFELGFRTAPVNNARFILWFIPAYIPWVYFQDAVAGTAGCLREYSYLVKKIKFPVEVLPVIKIMSSLAVHSFFMIFMLVVFGVYRYGISLLAVQLLYYALSMSFLLLGTGWLLSAAAVFMKDFTQIIGILLQLGFFMIPIFWNAADMNGHVVMMLKLNPVFYIVQGYRDSMLDGILFWDRPVYTAYFWIVSWLVFAAGEKLFRTSQKHFADLI